MALIKEIEFAKILAGMRQNGFTVYAQYDLSLSDKEILKGIIIAPDTGHASGYLEQTARIISEGTGLKSSLKGKKKYHAKNQDELK